MTEDKYRKVSTLFIASNFPPHPFLRDLLEDLASLILISLKSGALIFSGENRGDFLFTVINCKWAILRSYAAHIRFSF